MKVLIGGGGTGGHVFPAIAIAQAIKKLAPNTEILFVGAKDKLEMEKVPAAGFEIVGLPAAGFQRKLSFKNITFFFKLAACMLKSRKIVRDFKPDVAVGVGGYASGPILRAAAKKNVPVVLQEQNSHAGVTNKILAKKAVKIFTSYHGMEKYFDAEKIEFAGNPVRSDIVECVASKQEAREQLGLDKDKKTILVIGGSLGAATINKSVKKHLDEFKNSEIQLLWQTGKIYYDEIATFLNAGDFPLVKAMAFVKRMDLAYRAADVVVSRSGALSVSELCLAAKPVVFIPSPNVAEDHQTKNAMALVNENAAMIIKDNEAEDKLFEIVGQLCNDENAQERLSCNIAKLAVKDSASIIATRILEIGEKK